MNVLDESNKESEFYVLLCLSRGAESRKKILKALLLGSRNCSQIAKEVKLNWRTVNRHLQILSKDKLVKSVGFSQRKFYKLTTKGEETIRELQQKAKLNSLYKKEKGANPSEELNYEQTSGSL